MHTCISSHGLKRSWRSCPRRVNAGNKNTPSMHHPRRRNVTTLVVGLKKWSHTQKSHPKVVNPRDIAGEHTHTHTQKSTEVMHVQYSQVWWVHYGDWGKACSVPHHGGPQAPSVVTGPAPAPGPEACPAVGPVPTPVHAERTSFHIVLHYIATYICYGRHPYSHC